MRRNKKRHSVSPVTTSVTTGISEQVNAKKKKRNSGFYIPTLIIITFVLSMIIPDQVYFVTAIQDITISSFVINFIGVVYSLGLITDAFIYVFIFAEVRRVGCRIFKRWLYS